MTKAGSFRRRDELFMRRALEAAVMGFPEATPNPLVGCVIVGGDRILSQGYHQCFGGAHAEVEALRRLRSTKEPLTAYVTLEPCSYWGKTPPCVEALKKAGISQVVAAMSDPNPRVSGRGFLALRRAGIKVNFGCLEKEAQSLNKPFSTQMGLKRPYIILKCAMTLDGKITDRRGRSKWITNSASREISRKIRSVVDAIAVGAKTVAADDPRLMSPAGERHPLRVIFDQKLWISPGRRILKTSQAGTLIVTSNKESPRLTEILNKDVELLLVDHHEHGLDLPQALKLLALKGVQTMIVEGGGQTHSRFLETGLFDEVLWFMAPKLIGGLASKTAISGIGVDLTQAVHLKSWNAHKISGDLLIHGSRDSQGHYWTILERFIEKEMENFKRI